jgi:competence protein ComGC
MGYAAGRRGFSLLDLLVSIAVIALLMGIMAPVLSKVTDATHRVLCQTNVRELGLATTLFADDHNDRLPPSVFSGTVERGSFAPQEMQTLRVGGASGDWDGLGWLFEREYAQAPEVFYCPAHKGENPYHVYEGAWFTWGMSVVGNYHFRAIPSDEAYLHQLDPRTALIADGMRSASDYNHRVGSNVLRADMSIEWFPDRQGILGDLIPAAADEPQADENVFAAWWLIERGGLDDYPGLPWAPSGGGLPPGLHAEIPDPEL